MTGVLLGLALALPARAAVSVEASQRLLTASKDFYRSESAVAARLPLGFEAGAAYAVFDTKNRPKTECWTATAGRDWGLVSVGGGYSVIPRSDDYKAASSEAHAEVKTPNPEFQTSLFGGVRFLYHSQFRDAPAGFTERSDLTQRIATARVNQRVRKTNLGVEIAEYQYGRALTQNTVRDHPRRDIFVWGELQGLVRGLPEHSVKVGLSQRVLDYPLFVWASYQTFNLSSASILAGGTVDTYRVGARATLFGRLKAGFDYQHFRETPGRETDLYGLELSARFGG